MTSLNVDQIHNVHFHFSSRLGSLKETLENEDEGHKPLYLLVFIIFFMVFFKVPLWGNLFVA